MTDYILQIRVKNGPMLRALRASRYGTAAELSRACGVDQGRIGQYLNLRATPLRDDGEYRPDILTIAAYLHTSPEELFPPQHMRRSLECNAAEVDASLDDIANYLVADNGNNPLRITEQNEVVGQLEGAIKELPARYQRALELRYGIHGDEEHDLRAIGRQLGVSGVRAGQIILSAERKLRKKLSGETYGKMDLSAFD